MFGKKKNQSTVTLHLSSPEPLDGPTTATLRVGDTYRLNMLTIDCVKNETCSDAKSTDYAFEVVSID